MKNATWAEAVPPVLCVSTLASVLPADVRETLTGLPEVVRVTVRLVTGVRLEEVVEKVPELTEVTTLPIAPVVVEIALGANAVWSTP